MVIWPAISSETCCLSATEIAGFLPSAVTSASLVAAEASPRVFTSTWESVACFWCAATVAWSTTTPWRRSLGS